jgi:recombinational DNA repair protein RecR
MRIKDLPVCKTCNNKSTSVPCKVCGKNRDRVLFELLCIKEKRESLKRIHAAMVRFRMESTGCATLDLEVLDNFGKWLETLPKENPLYVYYERMKSSTVLELFHMFKFKLTGQNRSEFVKDYEAYLTSKRDEINRLIKDNELFDLLQNRGMIYDSRNSVSL